MKKEYDICKSSEHLYIRITPEKCLYLQILKRNPRKLHRNLKRLKVGNILVFPPPSGNNVWDKMPIKNILDLLKRGKPEENARELIYSEFGNIVFGLTRYEKEYFQIYFRSRERLESMLKSLVRNRESGRWMDFKGKSIWITKTKVRKALRELWPNN